MHAIPDNVYFLDDAETEFLALEGHQRGLVLKALCKIARSPLEFGKALGKRGSSDLTAFRSTRVDKGNLRIVWVTTPTGQVQIVVVTAVGPRSDEEVYVVAAKRRAGALSLKDLIVEMIGKKD